MKRRSPLLNYVLTLVSGGQFGLVWLFMMASDVSKLRTNFTPRLPAFSVAYVVLYFVYMVLVGYNMYLIGTATTETYLSVRTRMIPIEPLLLIAVALLAYPMYLLIKVASFVRLNGSITPGYAVLVLLFFLCLLSLPLLQNRLNALHEKHA